MGVLSIRIRSRIHEIFKTFPFLPKATWVPHQFEFELSKL